MDMRFGTWNVGSLYRVGSLKTVRSELAKCNLDLAAVQEVRWDKVGSEPAECYMRFCGNGKAEHCLGTGSYEHGNEPLSSIKGREFLD
jgi:exonuclease III